MLPSATHRVTLEGRPAPAPDPEVPATKPPQPLQSAGAVPRPGCAAGALLALPAASPRGHARASVRPARLPAESFSAPCLRTSRLRHTWVASSCPAVWAQATQAERAGHGRCPAATRVLPRSTQASAPSHPIATCSKRPHHTLGSQVHVACLWSKEQRWGSQCHILTGG